MRPTPPYAPLGNLTFIPPLERYCEPPPPYCASQIDQSDADDYASVGQQFQSMRTAHHAWQQQCMLTMDAAKRCIELLSDDAAFFSRPTFRRSMQTDCSHIHKESEKLFAQSARLLNFGEDAIDNDDAAAAAHAVVLSARLFATSGEHRLADLLRIANSYEVELCAQQNHHSARAHQILPCDAQLPVITFSAVQKRDLFCSITMAHISEIQRPLAIFVGDSYNIFDAEALERYLQNNRDNLTRPDAFFNPAACQWMAFAKLYRVKNPSIPWQHIKHAGSHALHFLKHLLPVSATAPARPDELMRHPLDQ